MTFVDAFVYFVNPLVELIGPPMGNLLEAINNKMIDNNIDKKDVMKYLPVVVLFFYACLIIILMIVFRYQLFYRKKTPNRRTQVGIKKIEEKEENKSTTIPLEQKKNE